MFFFVFAYVSLVLLIFHWFGLFWDFARYFAINGPPTDAAAQLASQAAQLHLASEWTEPGAHLDTVLAQMNLPHYNGTEY